MAKGLAWLLGTLLLARANPPVIPVDVQTAVRQRVDYGYCPGIVVGMMNTNGPAYFSYGRTDLEGGPPVNEHTLFEIGSITKVFTTTLLADMAARGEVELSDAIQKFLPDGVTAPTRSSKSITLTHLATHTSGLPSLPANLEITDGSNPFAGYTGTQMYEFLDSYTLTRDPGALYEYSNYGVGLLGQLLARIAQVPYEGLLVGRIADELGLSDTRLSLRADQATRLARGYSGVVPVPPFEMTALEAAGDLRSTAHDLLAFLAANRGWRSTRLGPAMAETQRQRHGTSTPGLNIGLGWHLLTLTADTAVWHDGATIGQRAFAGFLRNGRTLVVVLANSDLDLTDLGLHLLDAAVPLTPTRRPATVAETDLRHCVGRYVRSDDDYFTIGLLRGHLTLQYSKDLGRALTLHASGGNRFYLAFPQATGTFRTNQAGQATALVWSQSGATSTYSKERVPSRLALGVVADGVRLSLSGDTDREYVIQASSDLVQWTSISTNTIWDDPIIDGGPARPSHRFFRVLER